MFKYIFKVAYLVAIYILLSTSTFAQDNWTWLNPAPLGYSVNASAVIPSSSTIIAVGDLGVIVKSTDNGTSWSRIPSGVTLSLKSVSFPTSTVGYIVGESSTILKTTNGGENWSALAPPVNGKTFTQVQFVSATTGFLNDKLSYNIYKTTDGGSIWSVYLSASGYFFNAIKMLDENNGFLVTSDGNVGKITNGFLSLTDIDNLSSTSLDVLDFYDANFGIIAGFAGTFRTTDGGLTWLSATTPIGFNPYDIKYSGSSTIVAVSSSESISYSSDNGSNWVSANSGGSPSLYSITFINSNNGFALGDYGTTYRTVNGGINWSAAYSNFDPTLTTVGTINSKDGITIHAGGHSKIFRSTDSGNSWAKSVLSPGGSNVTDIDFVSTSRGFAVSGSRIYITSDGGATWPVDPPEIATGLEECAFPTYMRGYLCGTSTTSVRYTTDSGESWNTLSVASGSYYSVASTPDSLLAFVCGVASSAGKVIKVYHNGTSMTTSVVYSLAWVTFYSIHFISSQIGWVAGSNGRIYKTVDGGTSWTQQTTNTSSNLNSIRFFDENYGVAVGATGLILKTTNGGTTWSTAIKSTNSFLFSVALIDESTTLVGGNSAVLLKSYNAPLPVELTTFTAAYRNGEVTLNWETKTEIDNYGFDIERKSSTTGWQKIGFVEGHFTTNSPKYYNFTDRPNGTGKIQYRLKQIDNDGSFEYSHIAEVIVGTLPDGYLLEQNYPNPFNPSTTIGFTTQTTGFVKLVVYNPLGETVKVLFSDIAEAGRYYKLEFDATGLNSGVYFYRLEAENFKTIKKLTLMK